MTRAELEHAIRAACDVADDVDVWVFGSQAILGSYPDAPPALRQSAEADVAPRNHPDRVDAIDGALGELSPFHDMHGFYVHGVPVESATLPDGWQVRTVPVSGRGARPATGWCIEAHDLAVSKLAAFREKDRAFVRTLLVERLVSAEVLLERLATVTIEHASRARLARWVEATRAGLE